MKLVSVNGGQSLENALVEALGPRRGPRILRKIERRTGDAALAPLGEGLMGVAYATAAGNVIKVTVDRSELDASAALMESSHPNIAAVHDVFLVRAGRREAVGVVYRQDVARTLDEARPDLAREIDDFTMEADRLVTDLVERGHPLDEAIAAGMLRLEALLDMHAGEHDEPIMADYAEAVRELAHRGVFTVDLTSTNVGVDERPGPVGVVFDVGQSRVPDAPRIQVLAGARLRALRA